MEYTVEEEVGFKYEVSDSETRFFHTSNDSYVKSGFQDSKVRKLLLLVDEEIAIWKEEDKEVVIPFSSLYLLDRDELDFLGIPDFYPYGFGFRINERINSSDFNVDLFFKRNDDDIIVNPEIIGSVIKISTTEKYIFDHDSYEMLMLIKKLNSVHNDKNKKLIYISRVSESINKINEKVPDQFTKYDIQELVSFDVLIEESEDGAVSVYPVPIKSENDDKSKVLSEDEEKEFHEQFKRQEDVRAQYFLRGKKLLVYNDSFENDEGELVIDDVLKHFKGLQNLKGKKKDALIKNPSSFFPETMRLDLSEFSERVKAIGRYVPVVLPFVMQSENDWFPSEGGLIIDGEKLFLTPENRDDLIKLIQDGLASDIKSVDYKGREYNVNEETLDALQKLKKAEQSKSKNSIQSKPINQNSLNTILIIKDNFFELEERGKLRKERVGSVSVPDSIKENIELYKHQEDGLKWLQDLWMKGSNGALLADDMGLGKTIQALMFCAWIKEQKIKMGIKENEIEPFLIVAPVALLDNWDNEYKCFLNWEVFKEPLKLHGSNAKQFKLENNFGISNEREFDPDEHEIESIISERGGFLFDVAEIKKYSLILTTYETVRDYQFSLSKINWSVIVLDEIQKIKNPKTLVSHAIKAMNYNFGLGLTGTPVENSWIDLWSIMDFVQPGHLGTLVDFNDRFEKKLNEPDIDKAELGESLKLEIGELLRRRYKEDHIDELPKKGIEKIPVELTSYQKELYSQVLYKATDGSKDEHVLTQLAAIRDISLCPYLPFKNEKKIENIPLQEIVANSSKISETFKIIDKIKARDEKVIIFLISRKTQSILQRLIIEKYCIKAHIINGTVSGGRRQTLVDKFQDLLGFNVIIMSPEAAGVGLNVTAANHVIHLSRPWNPAKEDQASDRVFRIGQKKNVTIYIPISTFSELGKDKSFDEILDNLLEKKRHLSRSVLVPAKIEKSDLMSIRNEMLGVDSKKRTKSITIEDIDDLTGVQFEKFCAIIYRKLGFNVDLTEISGDKGIDLIVRKEDGTGQLVQCKLKENPHSNVDASGVQQVISGKIHYTRMHQKYNFNLVVITNANDFTQGAKDLASENNVKLITREDLMTMLIKSEYDWADHIEVNF